jgi:hypothetical protein
MVTNWAPADQPESIRAGDAVYLSIVGNRPATCGDALDQHGKQFARIALPGADVEEDQARCCLVGGRIEVDLVLSRAANPELFGSLVSFGDQCGAVLHGSVVIVCGVAFGLGKRCPSSTGDREAALSSRRYQSRTSLLQKHDFLLL